MTPEAADAEFVLKSTPPRVSKDQLLRGRLGWDGEDLRNKTIIEVVAPAGFGKTSLLGQWRREALNLGALVAWLSFDERDDVARFSGALAYSMRIASGRPTFERAVAQTMRQGGNEQEGLTAWLAEVANLGAETVLILDEVQTVSASVLDSLLYLILNAPPNLRIVLASRKALQLPLSNFLARGLYTSLDVERLRFTRQETAAILKARFKDRITAESCMRLHDKAAGWPLGLQLAMVVIERQSDPNTAIATMDAATGDLERYFLEGLLNDLEPRVVEFLVRLAILDALQVELCGFVTGYEDAPELLKRLRETLPIFMDGPSAEWVRLHPMVREFLLGQLRKRPEVELQALHGRAARWLADHGLREVAAGQALAAGQDELAHGLISECMYGAALEADNVRLLYWLERIPPEELERHPRTLLGAAWVLALSERHRQAARLIEKIHADPAAPVEERFESALIHGAAAYFADHIDDMVDTFAPWKDQEVTSSSTLRAIYANCAAVAQIYRGNPEQARRMIRAAYAAVSPTLQAVRGWGEWGIGFGYLWEGQVQLAQEWLAEPSRRADEAIGRRNGVSAMLASAYAMALWELGDVDAAEDVLLDRLDVLERVSAPEAIVMGYQVAARLARLKGQQRRALDLLDNLFALGEVRGMPRYCVASLFEQARMHLVQGRMRSCIEACDRLAAMAAELDPASLLGRLLLLRIAQARGYAAIARADWEGVLAILEPALEEADKLRRGREGVEMRFLLAVARMHCGLEWKSHRDEALGLAEMYGMQRGLQELQTLAGDWRAGHAGAKEAPRDEPALAPARAAAPAEVVRTGGLLTAKEEEILLLLGRNLSNKQIASALGISDETVKWHVKHLFVKFNAGSRRHVVDRARMLGILGEGY
ncbi:MAG TPA: LuxR C-terminal-related transcriptional regulator [Aromatoleum sp.]|uniref:LuxR C-terminal-related transcriptional regulator n=1 Tax=Aromatoleum sp. TaxID=2307007 RepID=UPI002B48E150|nr:LuxR C-terminal-related transcriptional regulator [Aromatoleum sp.]HJV26992.1 LuxR C-terminal-related transcriptional regulator [Aromatoleum sp.]